MQLGVGNIRHAESFHQHGQTVLPVHTAGVKTDTAWQLPIQGRRFLLHRNIRMTFHDHIGLVLIAQIRIHGLRQQHIMGAATDHKIRQSHALFVREHIRKIHNDAHTGTVPQFCREQRRQCCGSVQTVHHHRGIFPDPEQCTKKGSKRHRGQFQDPVPEGGKMVIIRTVLHHSRQLHKLTVHGSFVDRRIGYNVHLRIGSQSRDQQPVVLLGLEAGMHFYIGKQFCVNRFRAG